MIYIGTSGFSYDDWKGYFYPADISKSRFLEYYCRYFNTCEINSTYYAPPSRKFIEGILKKSKGKAIFSIKLNRRITHEFDIDSEFCQGFRKSLEPLVEAGVMGSLLAQFPQSMKPDARSRNLLEKVFDEFGSYKLVFEFRHFRWANTRVFDWMRQRNIGLCCVDGPPVRGLFPRIVEVTSSEVAYLRFHGRNVEKWYNHREAYERYDYLYSQQELDEWIPRIKAMLSKARDVYVYYNNHYRAKAVQNALQLKMLLGNL